MVDQEKKLDLGRVILYFLCLYFRKIQAGYSEAEYNPLMMRFMEQCNKVINKLEASSVTTLKQLVLSFRAQQSGFQLEMKFAEIAQAKAYWQQVIAAFKGFSSLDVAKLLDDDPTSQLFFFVLLLRLSNCQRQDELISLDLPGYEAFFAEADRWRHPTRKIQVQ
jgi:hypothetical protein